jgi:hypothetical protein
VAQTYPRHARTAQAQELQPPQTRTALENPITDQFKLVVCIMSNLQMLERFESTDAASSLFGDRRLIEPERAETLTAVQIRQPTAVDLRIPKFKKVELGQTGKVRQPASVIAALRMLRPLSRDNPRM